MRPTDSQPGYSYTVSPGFWKSGEGSPRLGRDETRWVSNLKSMSSSAAPWQLVSTWNEFGEGSSVEDAAEWSEPGIFGAYVQAMHDVLAR